MIHRLMPQFDASSLRHTLANAKRLIKTRQQRKDSAKIHMNKTMQWRPKASESPCKTGQADTASVDWDVWNLLEGMANGPTEHKVFKHGSRPDNPRPLAKPNPFLRKGAAKQQWQAKTHLADGAADFDVFRLLEGMVGDPACMADPVHTISVDWNIWRMLEGMANESLLPRQNIVNHGSSAVANPHCSKTAEQENRPTTAMLPCAEEKTGLRYALRHSRRRPSKDEPCQIAGDHLLLTAASATIAYSPKQVAAYILSVNKIYKTAMSKPLPVPLPPSPKHHASPCPRMLDRKSVV